MINVLTFITDLSSIVRAEEKNLSLQNHLRRKEAELLQLQQTPLNLGNSTATLSLKVLVLAARLIFAKLLAKSLLLSHTAEHRASHLGRSNS